MTSRPDVLTRLAADRARSLDEVDGCGSIWPLLAVPGDELSALDRDVVEAHLDGCARCRAIALEVWLDGEVAPASTARAAALPVAISLGAPPRRARPRRLAWLSAAVAAAAAVVFAVLPGVLGDGDTPVTEAASQVWIPDPDRPISLVVVVQGTESWMGNDTYAATEADRHAGHHRHLAGALDDLATVLPPGSVVAVMSTSVDGTRVEWPLAPAERLSGDALGPQTAYRGRIGASMLDHSVELASDLLRQQRGHRVLLIIGDGCPLDPSAVEGFDIPTYRSLGGRLRSAGISVRSVLLDDDAQTSDEPCTSTVRALGDRTPRRASHGADLSTMVRAVIKSLR